MSKPEEKTKEKKVGPGRSGLQLEEPLLFEQSQKGRRADSLPKLDVEAQPIERWIPSAYLRQEIEGFPELSEPQVIRHFTRMSQWNYGIDLGAYPLGSCTMKYNPRLNEEIARLAGFAHLHPLVPETLAQGALQLMWELEGFLSEITGMEAVSLQPSAGAQGELTGLKIIRRYHEQKGNPRKKVIVPDSAHGTNPASCALAGYEVMEEFIGKKGILEAKTVAERMNEEVAAVMLTNPNTLGLFEKEILEISEIVHRKGGLVYCDGANLNAMLGVCKPGKMGVDVIQLNLHKTFSTPHGGGGPGSGPVAVKKGLEPFLPIPRIVKKGTGFALNFDRPQSIGRVRSFFGNFGMMVRAYAYIRTLGCEGLAQVGPLAVLNANYIRERLRPYYHLPYDHEPCMHECVFTDKNQETYGITTLDIAKRLLDYGFHPPTIYFPLVVSGALMIEPTETESPESVEEFVQAMIAIAKEAETNPQLLKDAPHRTKVRRLDEVKAARELKLRWQST
ncbi:MAG: aminomethyl-transferring glycine dehydrogenase subunit GcvPB [Deltaproteobacteria bacterium]|nr:aminomethyl-transferring glycine dehydrogenase subunit GcvPB [Deltaproteobacteria bacterium]